MGPRQPALTALLQASTVPSLAACCGQVSSGPRQGRRKEELVADLLQICRDSPSSHTWVCRQLLQGSSVLELNQWMTSLRRRGIKVPSNASVGRRKEDLLKALAEIDLPSQGTGTGSAIEPSGSASAPGCSLDLGNNVGASLETFSSTQAPCPQHTHLALPKMASRPGCTPQPDAAAGNAPGFGTAGMNGASAPVMTMVAFGTAAEPLKLQRRLGKTWRRIGKSQRKAIRATKSRQMKRALAEAMAEDPDGTIGGIRETVGKKLGVDMVGEKRLFFDILLWKMSSCTPTKRRKRPRFTLAVSRPRRAR